MRRIAGVLLIFALGVLAGGWLFAGARWRPFLETVRGERRIDEAELLGLVGSIAVRRTPGLVPRVVLTTPRTVVLVPFQPEARTHFVIVPRRDIKDVSDLRAGDEAYLVDAFAVAGRLARDNGLRRWRVFTRGPDEQAVRYLHFHLVSSEAPRGKPKPPPGK
jgi:histidine triad (HIT) family protein